MSDEYEECTECNNTFMPEEDNGAFWLDAPDSNFWNYICSKCITNNKDAYEEYNGQAKRIGEL